MRDQHTQNINNNKKRARRTLAQFGAVKYTTHLLEKFLSNMTATVSLTPPAANLDALEKAMCRHVLTVVKYFQGVPRVCLPRAETWLFPKT